MKHSFLIIIALYLGTNGYLLSRIWHLAPGSAGRIGLAVLWILLSVSPLAVIFAEPLFPSWAGPLLHKTGTAWPMIYLYAVLLFLLWDALHRTGLLPAMTSCRPAPLILGGILLALFLCGYLRYARKERVELHIEAPYPMDPLKIVAISDLHIGYGIGKREIGKWVELINREEPDAVLIAGDLIDNNLAPVREQDMASAFREIRSRYGVFAVPGNHEYYAGIEGSLAFMREAGITCLRDSVAVLPGNLCIAGRDDAANPTRRSLPLLLRDAGPDRPVILLDHQPRRLEDARENGVTLQFSGHTHRGQIWPLSWLTDRIFELSHGYLRKGDTHYYVTSGIGIWGGKFRIGTVSEYVVIHLSGKTEN